MKHIVDMYPLTKFDGGLTRLHEADDDTANWLNTVAMTAKWNTIGLGDRESI